MVGNSFFTKRESHIITYESGSNKSVVDYILLKKHHLKLVKDIKVIPSEEAVPQHKLLVCEIVIPKPKVEKRKFIPRLKSWKLREPATKELFEKKFNEKVPQDPLVGVDSTWNHLKERLLSTTKEVCGTTKNFSLKRETWWWNDTVDQRIKEKRKLWKAWKAGGDKEPYLQAKRLAKQAVYKAKKENEQQQSNNMKPGNYDIYRFVRQMRKSNQDVVG